MVSKHSDCCALSEVSQTKEVFYYFSVLKKMSEISFFEMGLPLNSKKLWRVVTTIQVSRKHRILRNFSVLWASLSYTVIHHMQCCRLTGC